LFFFLPIEVLAMSLLKRWLYVFSTGFTLVFYSELLFWGANSLTGFLETWLYYALATYLFLIAVAYFHVNTLWSLFLAGALYGWLVEGVLVQTTYENLPISISDTGLSWHALISVWVGWYILRRALLESSPRRTLIWGAALGIFAGLWLPFWGVDLSTEVIPFTLTKLALLMGVSVPLLAFNYWLQNRITPTPFVPHKLEVILLVSLFLLQFVVTVLPMYPLALIILPPLLLVLFFSLHRQRQNALHADTYLETLSGDIPTRNIASLFIMIPAALLAFALDQWLGLTPLPQYAIYLVTVPSGFIIFALSLFKIWRGPLQPSRQAKVTIKE
jgi:hypothetical protein